MMAEPSPTRPARSLFSELSLPEAGKLACVSGGFYSAFSVGWNGLLGPEWLRRMIINHTRKE
jgi:hypothetical protein